MTLPGKPTLDAARLTRKGSDLLCWWQSRCSSRSAGRPRTWRRAAVQGSARTRLMVGITLNIPASQPMQYASVSKDSLGGKAGCDESRLSGLGGGSPKPTIRKDSKARCFYPHSVPVLYSDKRGSNLEETRGRLRSGHDHGRLSAFAASNMREASLQKMDGENNIWRQ